MCGQITSWAISSDILRGPILFGPLTYPERSEGHFWAWIYLVRNIRQRDIKLLCVCRSADCGWRPLHPERRGAGTLLRQARHSRRGEVLQSLRGEQHRGEVLISLVEGRMRGKVFGVRRMRRSYTQPG